MAKKTTYLVGTKTALLGSELDSLADGASVTSGAYSNSAGNVGCHVEILAAFGIAGVNQQQSMYTNGTGGEIHVEIEGYEGTVTWAYNANAETVQTQLETLVGAGNVTVTGAGTFASPWIITFQGSLAFQEVPLIQVETEDLTAPDESDITIDTITDGVPEVTQFYDVGIGSGENLSSHETDSGDTWTVVSGSPVVGGTGITASGSDLFVATVARTYESHPVHGAMEYSFKSGSSLDDYVEFRLRYQDANNYIFCRLAPGGNATQGTLKIFKRISGTTTELATLNIGTIADDLDLTDRLLFELVGNDLTFVVNTETRGCHSVQATITELSSVKTVGIAMNVPENKMLHGLTRISFGQLEHQRVVTTAAAGDFTLTYPDLGETAAIAFDATADTFRSRLETVTYDGGEGPGIGLIVAKAVDGDETTWDYWFTGDLASIAHPQLTIDDSGLLLAVAGAGSATVGIVSGGGEDYSTWMELSAYRSTRGDYLAGKSGKFPTTGSMTISGSSSHDGSHVMIMHESNSNANGVFFYNTTIGTGMSFYFYDDSGFASYQILFGEPGQDNCVSTTLGSESAMWDFLRYGGVLSLTNGRTISWSPHGGNMLAVQTLNIDEDVDGGTYTLGNPEGGTSDPIAWNANSDALEAALNAAGVFGEDAVTVSGAWPSFVINFTGEEYSGLTIEDIIVDDSGLTIGEDVPGEGDVSTVLNADSGTPAISEVQQVSHTGSGGSLTLTLPGYGTTASIDWDANAAAAQSAMEAVVGAGNVVCTGNWSVETPMEFTFQGDLDGINLPEMTYTSSLSGSTEGSASIVISREPVNPTGVPASDATVDGWFLKTVDGTNFETSPPEREPDFVFDVAATNDEQRIVRTVRLPPGPVKLYVKNNTGEAARSSGNELNLQPYTYQTITVS
ncbi:hypothetical protein SH661x_003889 [Planctomicrobium sp. SH661]|uniref:hypothetical protein n=1 Tax=Planctomicrobium sp. SH661 TaxID=3448124 RepID=UPI003F5C639E